MNEHSQENTTSGQTGTVVMLEVATDNRENRFLIRISKGNTKILLEETEARWLEKALLDYLPLENRH